MFMVLIRLYLIEKLHLPGPGLCVDMNILPNPSRPLIKNPFELLLGILYVPGPGIFKFGNNDTALHSYLLNPNEVPFLGLTSNSEGLLYLSGEGLKVLGTRSVLFPKPIEVARLLINDEAS
jgi:hypothetical protein